MSLPPRVLYPIPEVAARWGCTPSDIAGWAATGRIEIATGISPMIIGTETVAGLVVIAAADILPMFRPCGTGPAACEVRRLRELGATEWKMIHPPDIALTVAKADLVIMADEMARFEDEHGMFRRRGGGGSVEPKYDWEGFYLAMILRIHNHGVPEEQTELVDEMQDWFMAQSADGKTPEESTIRKRVNPIWRALRSRD